MTDETTRPDGPPAVGRPGGGRPGGGRPPGGRPAGGRSHDPWQGDPQPYGAGGRGPDAAGSAPGPGPGPGPAGGFGVGRGAEAGGRWPVAPGGGRVGAAAGEPGERWPPAPGAPPPAPGPETSGGQSAEPDRARPEPPGPGSDAEPARGAVPAPAPGPAPATAETGSGAGPAPAAPPVPHEPVDPADAEAYWDARYGATDRVWSGRPNTALIRETTGLRPGRALDLGCGEGADAIWLAQRGWSVVAVDVSRVALDRARGHADQAGVGDRVHWQRHDLSESFPSGAFDLVSAHFLHSPFEMPRGRILRRAAVAVSPGGVLLIVGHAGPPPWEEDPHPEHHLPTPFEVYEALHLNPDSWELMVAHEHEREMTDPEGNPVTRMDNTLKIRRLSL